MNERLEEAFNKKKATYRCGNFWISSTILLCWIGFIIFAFTVWLTGWHTGSNFVYHPSLTTPDKQGLASFFYTIALFAIAGSTVSHILGIFYKFWQIERDPTINQDIDIIEFLNSSKTNVLFFRPIFFPFVAGIFATFFVFLLQGFGASLTRIVIVSLFVGIFVGYFSLKIFAKVTKVFRSIY